MLKKYSTELQSLFGFVIIQLLFKITFELVGAKKINNLPVIYFVYFFIFLAVLTLVLCFFNRKIAAIFGIFYGIINIIPALGLVLMKNIPSGYSYLRPFLVIVNCFFIIYFGFLEYKNYISYNENDIEKRLKRYRLLYIISLITSLIFFCFISIMKILKTVANIKFMQRFQGNNLIGMEKIVFTSVIVLIFLIISLFLNRKWAYIAGFIFGILLLFIFSLLTFMQKNPGKIIFLILPMAFCIISFSLLYIRNSKRKNPPA